ncbi:MAG: hypothetical protein JWQ74_2253 [Marmoricola sp.]|nr:hypothetical protein [Marmoricola sp.]
MSKMDEMRAMREARYEASRQDQGAPRPAATPAPAPRATKVVRAPQAVPEPPQEGLCGHRAISGRTCTRDKGHAAKSHRYS